MKYLVKIVLMVLLLGVTLFAKDVATVTGLSGEAFIQRDSQNIEVSLGVKLQENDTIVTDSKAKVQIIFEDETIITLGKNSNFSISEYLFEGEKKPVARFAMLKGAMRTITGQIGKVAPNKFSVTTKTATIGIRGTNFTVLIGEDGSHNIYCTYGAISVTFEGNEYVVREGSYLYISPDGKVEIKEFTPEELKNMKEKSFGKSEKKEEKSGGSVSAEGQVDATTNDDGDIVVKDITDLSRDATQTTIQTTTGIILTYDIEGYGTRSTDYGRIYSLNLGLKYKPDEETAMLTSGSFSYIDGSEDRTYTLAPTSSFASYINTQFSDVNYDSGLTVTHIHTNPSENYFRSMENAVDSDYISWGEWAIRYETDGTQIPIDEEGLWVAGDPTDADVIAGMTGSFNYSGAYKAYDFGNNNGALINGNASLFVDFGNDEVDLHIDYVGDNSFSAMPISGNSFSGPEDGGAGSASGTFYGPNAEVAGGEFIIDDGYGVQAKGVYQVGNKTPDTGGGSVPY